MSYVLFHTKIMRDLSVASSVSMFESEVIFKQGYVHYWVKGISFYRNCGAASVGEWYMKIWFISGVNNVNWPPYRDWKADVSSVSPSSERQPFER